MILSHFSYNRVLHYRALLVRFISTTKNWFILKTLLNNYSSFDIQVYRLNDIAPRDDSDSILSKENKKDSRFPDKWVDKKYKVIVFL